MTLSAILSLQFLLNLIAAISLLTKRRQSSIAITHNVVTVVRETEEKES
jgi:hypothetical protein